MRRFSINDVGSLIKFLDAETRTAAKKGLLAAAHRTVAHITTVIIPSEERPPVDTGAYRAAWRADKLASGAVVHNTLPYAPIIEFGARAGNIKIGRKMIEALTAWVRRKGISSDDARGTAWAIARSMQRRGIFNGGRGLRVMEKAEKKITTFIREEIERELRKIGK